MYEPDWGKINVQEIYRAVDEQCITSVYSKLLYQHIPEKLFRHRFVKALVQHIIPVPDCFYLAFGKQCAYDFFQTHDVIYWCYVAVGKALKTCKIPFPDIASVQTR